MPGVPRMRTDMKRVVASTLCVFAVTTSSLLAGQNAAPAQRASGSTLSATTRQKLMDSLTRGGAYLKQQRKPDGTCEVHPGITAMAAAALLRQPGLTREQALPATGQTL